jgi:hypothetical protein
MNKAAIMLIIILIFLVLFYIEQLNLKFEWLLNNPPGTDFNPTDGAITLDEVTNPLIIKSPINGFN